MEDFLDPLGVTLEQFSEEFTGSWIFGYAVALAAAGVHPMILCVSGRVNRPTHLTHRPTGTPIRVIPSSRLYRMARRWMVHPYGRTFKKMFGKRLGFKLLALPFLVAVRELGIYAATPPIALARELRRAGSDALVCQEYEYPRFDVAVMVCRILRLPVFATFQGGDYHHSRVERLTRPFALRRASGLFIASGPEVERVHVRYGVPSSRIRRIPNPIDPEEWAWTDRERREAREELEIPPGAVVLGWHGRVAIRKKGLDLLLHAWERVRAGNADRTLRLLLIGSGEDDERFREMLREVGLGVIWRREFIHERARLRRFLSAADVYVFPSRHEGFAVAPGEAMACGLPIVAADAAGIAELLDGGERSGGVIVPREDAAALAAAAQSLISDPARRAELGARARVTVERCLSSLAVGRQLRAALNFDVAE